MRTTKIALALWPILLLASPALAQDAKPKATKPKAKEPKAKKPKAKKPKATAPDQITLKSGEVLQGQIVTMDGKKLTFKSLQLGKQEIPWKKVESVKSTVGSIQGGKGHTWVLKNETVKIAGVIEVKGGAVTVTDASGAVQNFTRADLKAINPAPPKVELDYWKFNATIGITATYGNTRTRTFAGLVGIEREDDNTRFFLKGVTTYGQDDGDENAKAHRLDGQFDYKITERLYATPVVGHVFYDKFQNIDYRYRVGPGVGYWILKDKKFIMWNAELGFSYGVTKYRTAVARVGRREHSTAVRLATKIRWIVASWLTFDGTWESYIGTKDIQDTIHHGTVNFGFKLYKGLALNIAGIYDRNEHPRRNATGKIPKRDDFKLIIGIGVTF